MSRQGLTNVTRTGKFPVSLKNSPPVSAPIALLQTENASSWSLGSPSTWPKWLIALVIGVPIAAGGAFWYYSEQRKRWDYLEEAAAPGKSGSRFLGAGDHASSTSLKSSSSSIRKEPATLAERIAQIRSEGNQLFRAKRYLDAKNRYSEAIELALLNNRSDLELAQCLQNRAACNEQLKHFDDVIEDCNTAIEIDKHYGKAYARRSRGRERRGQLQGAVQDLMAASILTNFENAEYRERSEKLIHQYATNLAQEILTKRKVEGYRPKLSKTFVRQFHHGFSQDPVKISMDEVKSSESQRPIDTALRALSDGDYDGDYDGIIDLCTESIQESANEPQTLAVLLRGTMYFLFGNTDAAKSDFEFVISSPQATLKEKSNARIKLACLSLQEQVDPERVLTRLNDAAQLDPSNPDIYFHKAQCYMLFNHFDLCLADFRRARDLLGDNDPICSFHIAHIEFRIRASDNPTDPAYLAELEKKIDPLNSSEGYVLLGQLFMEARDFEKSRHYFEQALSDDADSHNAVVYCQQAMLELTWHEDRYAAVDLLVKAIKADPNYSAARELMMDLELQAGNFESAKEHYELCLQLAKSEAELVSVIQAYQIAEVGHFVYADLGIADQSPMHV